MSDGTNPFDVLLSAFVGPTPAVQRSRARYAELMEQVDTGVDPDYIGQFESFHGMEHSEIHRLAQTLSAEAMSTLSNEWHKLGTTFSFSIALGTVMILDKITVGWGGDAGAAAEAAVRHFGHSAQQLCTACLAVSQKLRIASEVGAHVQSAIGPPPPTVPVSVLDLGPLSSASMAERAEAERQQAVRVMETLYKPSYRDSGSAVPVLPPPHEIVGNGSGGVGSGRGGSGGAVPGRGGDPSGSPADAAGTGTGAAGSGGGDPGSSRPGSNDPSGHRDTDRGRTGSTGADPAGSAATSTGPAATSPASTAPTGTTVPGYPSGTGIGGGHPGGGPGSAGGHSMLGPGAVGGVGAPGSAPPPGTPSANPAGRGTGMRPMGMFPGMMAGAGQRGADEERRAASYLVTGENGHELIGSLPDSVPPVLGVDPA